MSSVNKNTETLLQQIEQVLGRPVRTPQDFSFLSESIYERTHATVSVSTIKRLYGYVTSEGSLRRSTLDILSRFVGYQNWAVFCRRDMAMLVESNPILTESMSADELCEDDVLRVTWPPNRECYFRCTAPHEFVVERSLNSKLSPGDTFRCHLFVMGEALYLENVCMQGAAPVPYVCGRNNGIGFSLVQ